MHDLDATFLTRDKKLDIQANPYDIPGNRSMISKGSSFTDLSEASISQSALEDAMHDLSTSSSTRYESND